IAWWQEDIAAARRFYEEALAIERHLGDPAHIADALYNQAFVVAAGGDFEGAFWLCEESLEFLAGFLGDPEAEARAHLPEETARRAWEEGRRSGVDAGLARASQAR